MSHRRPVHTPGNVRGTVAFSMGAVPPNKNCSSSEYCAQGFSTNIFINLANNTRLDANGFSIFGEVLPPGMDVVDRLFAGYGECSELCPARAGALREEGARIDPFCVGFGTACQGVSMDRLLAEGTDYWRREKRRLDVVHDVRTYPSHPGRGRDHAAMQ
jgi:hypothetical protein